ncbi:probable LRR receptor-like serine/threonine-protein kinase At3g47570 [Malus sylvestris]|uniref:probable LRR receptor-like serine/threonine-protein kinase At3g47570 n=1 Tax=Malus sylvestris TaxID=3752 RepID=UPI0021AC613B|nr:probable LRR receptor-like serine/threonine-protein kinase At3g47570 [Malus sylvestris]
MDVSKPSLLNHFVSNAGLCGAARLHVPPCKRKGTWKLRQRLPCYYLNYKGKEFHSWNLLFDKMRHNIRHQNLIKTVSCCSEVDFKVFVLQCMPNGSLEKRLHSQKHSWSILERLNIMIDVASVLEYLHYGYSIPIVQCDVKPSNIILDNKILANVAHFSIAKVLGQMRFYDLNYDPWPQLGHLQLKGLEG